MVPLATADVYGENVGCKTRTYGSSDVSVTRNDNSESISSFSSTRPVPDTARRGEAASIS
jgi:hypothetical protein